MLVLLEPELEHNWESIKQSAASDIYTTVHLTLTPENHGDFSAYIERLAAMEVQSISLSASSDDLNDELASAQEYAANLDISLVWDTPVPYSQKNPFALEFKGRERPPGAGHAWLYVEPDGDVLPDQEINEVLGNLVRDPWDQIWQAALDRLD
jgi:MoaA/NifB/PqqE/SkfB family radical SAM enzyme